MHGAYSLGISIKKKVCRACRVDPLFANSPVQVNIVNPDQTAPKGNGSLQFRMLFTFHKAMFHFKNKCFSDLSSIQCSSLQTLRTLTSLLH